MRNLWNRSVLCVSCIAMIGCTTLVPVNTAGPEHRKAAVSDVVVVLTHAGETHEARLTRFDEHEIELAAAAGGPAHTLKREHIVTLERRQFSMDRTLLLVAGIVGVLLIYASVATVSAFSKVY